MQDQPFSGDEDPLEDLLYEEIDLVLEQAHYQQLHDALVILRSEIILARDKARRLLPVLAVPSLLYLKWDAGEHPHHMIQFLNLARERSDAAISKIEEAHIRHLKAGGLL